MQPNHWEVIRTLNKLCTGIIREIETQLAKQKAEDELAAKKAKDKKKQREEMVRLGAEQQEKEKSEALRRLMEEEEIIKTVEHELEVKRKAFAMRKGLPKSSSMMTMTVTTRTMTMTTRPVYPPLENRYVMFEHDLFDFILTIVTYYIRRLRRKRPNSKERKKIARRRSRQFTPP